LTVVCKNSQRNSLFYSENLFKIQNTLFSNNGGGYILEEEQENPYVRSKYSVRLHKVIVTLK